MKRWTYFVMGVVMFFIAFCAFVIQRADLAPNYTHYSLIKPILWASPFFILGILQIILGIKNIDNKKSEKSIKIAYAIIITSFLLPPLAYIIFPLAVIFYFGTTALAITSLFYALKALFKK
ncbi:MAG: hypothetical protein KKB79_01055 [Nanoarchaeota archaeon]|nr:hypothetical protein [Nanoarchaeota archaeon]